MKMFRGTSLAFAVAVVGMAASAAPALAQGKGVKVTVATGAWRRAVSVSVLGAYAKTGTQLYWFADPFDPVTGMFSSQRAFANMTAIGPAAVGNSSATKLWIAKYNTTSLGVFVPSTELVFGLWLPNNTWLFTGAANKKGTNFTQLPSVGSKFLVNNPNVGASGTIYDFYGYNTHNTKVVDYTDFVFRTTEASVTPEPASIALLGTGLLGFGGVGAFRRRRS